MIRPTTYSAAAVLAGGLAIGSHVPAHAAGRIDDGYRSVDQLLDDCGRIAAGSDRCRLAHYGHSREGRPLVVLTLAGDPPLADERPALLVVAGLDGRHRVGPETAVRVAQRLLADHGGLLDGATVYVLPLANPDGAARNEGDLNPGHVGTLRPVDDDRDARVDEDGPADLDGNGVITMMRIADPPADMPRTHLPDPAEPRLLIEADAAKGQRPAYAVTIEGLDADDDGRVAEDGPGAVDLDRNFMHEWPEHARDAGPYPLSEPESLALARFVLDRRNIVASIVYGRHDSLVDVPAGKGRDVSGRGPKDLDADDVPLYTEMSKLFKEQTGQQRAPKDDADGSLHAWLYAQRGVPTFATAVWGRPDPPKPAEPEAGQPAVGGDDEDDASAGEAEAAPRERGAKGGKKEQEPKPVDEEAAAWLAWSDAVRDGAGFVPWTPVEHPTFGRVEVGGFVPGFRMNPPAGELEGLAEAQTAFAVAVLERRPSLALPAPAVRRLAPGLYEVHMTIVNEGYLPTATAMARKSRAVMPTVVRLSVPIEDIVAGERVSRHWGIDGSGRTVLQHWILRVDDGATVEVEVRNEQLGDVTVRFKAQDTGKENAR